MFDQRLMPGEALDDLVDAESSQALDTLYIDSSAAKELGAKAL